MFQKDVRQRLEEIQCPESAFARLLEVNKSRFSQWLNEKVVFRNGQVRDIILAVQFCEALASKSRLPIEFRETGKLLPLWRKFHQQALKELVLTVPKPVIEKIERIAATG